MSLKKTILDDVKTAMRAGDKTRLGTLRLITAAIKQREVDERFELVDSDVLAVIEKMIKQRRDAEQQYLKADRSDLAAIEQSEIVILQDYQPTQLGDDELVAAVEAEIAAQGASGMQAMGQVMAALKSSLQGKADMAKVSQLVKQLLNA